MFAINTSVIYPTLQSKASNDDYAVGSSHPEKAASKEAFHLDHACQVAAQNAYLPGSYMAMVSTPGHSLEMILKTHHKEEFPMVNTKVKMCDPPLECPSFQSYPHLLFPSS